MRKNMSTNNWMTVMDKMLRGILDEATSSLRDIKKCFDKEGRSFDEEFKKYFLQASNNSLVAAYCNFELELLLQTRHTKSNAVNQVVPNSIDNFMIHVCHNDAVSNRSVAGENTIQSVEKCLESAVALESERDEAPANNMILILDSDDEENSREKPIMSTGQRVVADKEIASANGVIMGSGHGATASINQNLNSSCNDEDASNNKKDDQTEVKEEASEPNKVETNDDEDIALVLVQVGRPIPMESNDASMNARSNGKIPVNTIRTNRSSAATFKRADLIVGGKSNNTNISPNNSSSNKRAMRTSAETTASAQIYSKVVKRHKCRFCEYSSNFKASVGKHERIHTGEKPHRCSRCSKGFTQMNSLKHHAKVHAKEFAFHCLGCFEGFTQKTEHDAHVKVCKSPRYECHICKKNSFVHKRNLEVHMRTHSGKNLFEAF
ncbi:zinc finger protein 165-like isoform X2 [Sitodiplosis mosellana]|uniref:zinc finger protein 165-like isoform X2 n=1 Tax=Sitodiplosis mosellana TaxID=263140 RepID=UPI0024442CB4|nr:zinc finger protein 165-like isoform X2 [Sitodiplosis mosellana]